MRLSLFLYFLVLTLFPAQILYAQEQEAVAPEFETETVSEDVRMSNEMLERIKFRAPPLQINQMPSLFFTSDEIALISAVRRGVIARPPTESELNENNAEEEIVPERGIRELSLGGIVFRSSSDWTIWMNGQKVTPQRIPPEVLDIRVSKDHIKIKWFDAYTNQIFPIKLKPHQRFNIDTRIFLPG
jgi:hypothetical protein